MAAALAVVGLGGVRSGGAIWCRSPYTLSAVEKKRDSPLRIPYPFCTAPPLLLPPCRFERKTEATSTVVLPAGTTAAAALDRVLRLPSVCSKRFLTTKVDRCVTGLIAQQQCVGPLQLPVSDVAVMAQTHFGLTGIATSIGEQPLKVTRMRRAAAVLCCSVPAAVLLSLSSGWAERCRQV